MRFVRARNLIRRNLPDTLLLDELLIVIDLVLIALLLILAATPQEAVFAINAVSDRIAVESKAGEVPINWGELPVGFPQAATAVYAACDQWLFNVSDLQVAVRITVTGTKSGIVADISSMAHNSLGDLHCSTGEVAKAPARLVISWPAEDAKTLLLTLSGRLLLGAVPPGDAISAKILRSGVLFLESHAQGASAGGAQTSFDLALGDELRIIEGGQSVMSHVLVEYKEDRLHVVARAKGDHAEIIRFGQERVDGSIIAPNLFDKIRSRSGWETMLLMAAIFIHLLSCIARIADRLRGQGKQP